MTDFTVHQLTVFRTVAHELSYTRAAEALYLSQPAVTQQVRSLERMVGLQLFARRGRGIMLTASGSAMLRHTERMLDLLTETVSMVQEVHALERGRVIIGASTSAGTYLLPPLLADFHALYPHILVTLTIAHRPVIEERLLSHQVELVIMSTIQQEDRFSADFLRPYELVIVAAPEHRLANRGNLTAADLQEETFLLREQGASTRLDTEIHFAQLGIPWRHYLELGGIGANKEGVVAGLGISVLSREAVESEVAGGDLVILDVAGFPLRREWHLVTLKERRLSHAATALRQFLLSLKD